MEKITIKVNGKDYTVQDTEHLEEVATTQSVVEEKFQMKKIIPKSFITIVLSAITMGLLLGWMLFQFLPNEQENQTEKVVTTIPTPTPTQTKTIQKQSIDIFVIQAGAFQSEDTVKKMISDFQKKSMPAIGTGSQPTYIVIGMGSSKETLQTLQDKYKQEKISFYTKHWGVASVVASSELRYLLDNYAKKDDVELQKILQQLQGIQQENMSSADKNFITQLIKTTQIFMKTSEVYARQVELLQLFQLMQWE